VQVWKLYLLGDSWSLSLALSNLRNVPYILVSLGDILSDVLEYIGGIIGDVLEEVQLQLLQLSIVLIMWLWDFLSGELYLEKDVLYWLSIGYSVAFDIILSSKGYGARGWLCAYGWVTIL
jgi:hypothetical protein